MKDTEQRILSRQVGKTLTTEEMEQVNGSGTTYYSYSTGGLPPDRGGGIDYEWTW